MMKNLKLLLMAAISAMTLSACAANKTQADTTKTTEMPRHLAQRDFSLHAVNSNGEKTIVKGNDWFSFAVPVGWSTTVDSESDKEYKVYEFKIYPPSEGTKMPSTMFVSYYAEDNEDIATYQEFIRVNSQNILRGGKTVEWEKYEPVKEGKVAGRNAYIVARNCRHFLHPNSKDDTAVMKKEKMYVIPAEKGYYVIRYAAEEQYFDKNLVAFEDIASSFLGLY